MNTLERQPDFPRVDLTERNVDFLRTFLLSANLPHTISPENRDGHLEEHLRQYDLIASDSGIDATRHLYDTVQESQSEAINNGRFGFTYGYTLYEIITSLVSPGEFLARDIPTVVATRSLEDALKQRSLHDYMNSAKLKLIEEQRLTTQLIGQSAANLYAVSAEDAILGAGVKRQIELNRREYTQKLLQ
jgi:hypothetical protein